MKSLVSIAVAVLIGCASMSAGVLSPVFKEFKAEKNCTVVKLPRMAMWLARMCTSEPVLGKVDSMNVLTMECSDSSLVGKIETRTKELDVGLEPLIRVNYGGEKVSIWMEGTEKKIKSIYVFVNEGGREATLVEFNGNFSLDDIEALVAKAQKSNK